MKKLMAILLISATIAVLILSGCGEDKTDIATEFLAAGHIEQAIEILDQEIKDNPRNAKAYYTRGMIAVAKRDRDATVSKYFNSAILLDEDYRDIIFESVFSYIDSSIEQQNLSAIDDITEMALNFAPDKREKAGEMLFAKVESSLKLNPIENRDMVDVLRYVIKCKSSLSQDAAELLHSCGKLLWDKGFKDQTSLKTINKYLKKACDFDQKIKQDVSNTYLEMAKALLAESGFAEESLHFMTASYDLNDEKGEEIADLFLELAEKSIKSEEYGSAFSYTQMAVNFDSESSVQAEQLRKKIPVIIETFEDKANCLFTPVEGRWKHQNGATGLGFGPSSMKNSVAVCSAPFSTGTLEYDFNITSARYADCDILLSYVDKRNFVRVSICPYRGDSKDRIDIVTNGKGQQLVKREPTVQLNTWNHVRIERTTDHITVFLNGQEYLRAQVPPPSTSTFAVRFWDRGLIDNFMIRSSGSTSHGNQFRGAISDSEPKNKSSQIDSPRRLFEEIYSLATAGRYGELERHIFYRHRDKIIKGIKEHKPYGDFAYSNEALAKIISSTRGEIQTLPQGNKFEYIEDWMDDPTINHITNTQPDDISVFIHERFPLHILVIKIEGDYKLIFWEDINNILKK